MIFRDESHRVTLEHENPLVRRRDDGLYELVEDFILYIDAIRLVIPAGVTTDFSSVPWYFSWIAASEKHDLAGIVHDQLFKWGRWQPHGYKIDRARADEVWRLVAQAGQVSCSPREAWVMWSGLRLGSWRPWRKYRRGDLPWQEEVGNEAAADPISDPVSIPRGRRRTRYGRRRRNRTGRNRR